MLSRFGNVLYWICSGIAAAVAIGAVAFVYTETRSDAYVGAGLILGTAIVIWLIGRAILYVLANK